MLMWFLDWRVQFEKAQAKQRKLDEEKTHKDTIRANYENLVKEILGKKDTQWNYFG